MRAEVEEEADMRLPPVKGWEVYTPWKGEWSSEDHTLECSRHPTGPTPPICLLFGCMHCRFYSVHVQNVQ